MLLREKLTPKIQPYKNLKEPNENNEFPITEHNKHEDYRVIVLFAIFLVAAFIATFFFPKDEDEYSKTFKFGDYINDDCVRIEFPISKILPDSRIIRLLIRFENNGYHGRQIYDANIMIKRGDDTDSHLNGTYKGRSILVGTRQQVFSDACPHYTNATAIFEFPTNCFDQQSQVTLIWCIGNSKVTLFKVLYHYAAIAYLVFMIVYFFKNIGFRAPEETITFVVVIAAIVHIGPLYGVRLHAPSRIFLIIDRLGENILGAILNFAVLSIFALTAPCCAEIIEGNCVIAWIYFVISAFFDVLPYIVVLYGEMTFDLAEGVKMFAKIGSVLSFFFAFSIFHKQYKDYRTIKQRFRYRFWTIIYMCVVFAVPYCISKALSLLTNVLSIVSQDFISVVLALALARAFASLFWNRKFAPFNIFHREDAKWKLE